MSIVYSPRIQSLEKILGIDSNFLGAPTLRATWRNSRVAILPIPFEQTGLPVNLSEDPLPLLTFRVLRRIPHIATFGGALLTGLWWITNRRNEVAKEEGQ